MELINASKHEFEDISNERTREYHFINRVLHIDEPMNVNVSKSGGHRLVTKNGVCYYIPPKWLWIKWTVHPAPKPHFTF